MGTNKAVVGVDQLYYAILTSDSSSGATWQAAVAVPGVTEIGVNPNGAVTTLFADNGPAVTANTIGEIEVSLKLADLTPTERAILLGHARVGGVTKYNANDISPDVAIGFRTMLSDGNFGYCWLLKGKFAETKETFTTRKDKMEFQVPSLTGKFSILAYNGEYKRTTRTDDPDYVAATGANWFTNGPLGTTDTTAPTVSSSIPTDGATGVSVSANLTVTFNEAIQRSLATSDNFMVIKASDGTDVAASVSIDANGTTVTIDPVSNLSAATAYLLIVSTAVKNITGIPLANKYIVNFQTA